MKKVSRKGSFVLRDGKTHYRREHMTTVPAPVKGSSSEAHSLKSGVQALIEENETTGTGRAKVKPLGYFSTLYYLARGSLSEKRQFFRRDGSCVVLFSANNQIVAEHMGPGSNFTTSSRVQGLNCSGVSLQGSTITGFCFEDSDFSGADMDGVTLSNGEFWRRTTWKDVSFQGASLKRAVFDGVALCGNIDFRDTDVEKADFSNVVLFSSDRAVLDFSGSNVSGEQIDSILKKKPKVQGLVLDQKQKHSWFREATDHNFHRVVYEQVYLEGVLERTGIESDFFYCNVVGW